MLAHLKRQKNKVTWFQLKTHFKSVTHFFLESDGNKIKILLRNYLIMELKVSVSKKNEKNKVTWFQLKTHFKSATRFF